MKTILKILAALMQLTGGYHADSLNAQEYAATDSVTADIMRIRVQDVVSEWKEKDYDFAWEMFGEEFDLELIL